MPAIALVDHRHVQLARLDEFRVGSIAIEHGAVHGEVGRVDLQDETGLVDRQVLFAHLAGESGEVGLVGIVVGIEHGRGDDTRRRRGHELFGERLVVAGDALVAGDLGFDLRGVVIVQFALRLRRVLLLAHRRKAMRQVFDQLGEFLEFAAAPPFRFAAKPGHTPRHVGLEADALLLAVIADIDPGFLLLRDHVAHRLLHRGVELRLVVVFAGLAAHQ